MFLKKNIKLLIIIFISISVAIFLLKPTIIGNSVYKQIKDSNYTVETYGENIQDLKSELLVSNTNLTSYGYFNKLLLEELKGSSNNLYSCNEELNDLKLKLELSKEKYKDEIDEIKTNLNEKDKELNKIKSEKEEEINTLEEKHNLLAENTANIYVLQGKSG